MLDTSHLGTPFLVGGWFFRWLLCRGILLSIDDGFWVMVIPRRRSDIFFSHWSMRCRREISFDMLILGHTLLINDWFWRYFLYLRFAYFERMYSYWGIATLLIFEIETWPSVYDCYFRWIIKIMIFFRSIFLAHLVWFDYPLTLVGHPNILPLIPLYLHLSCQSLAYLLLSSPISSSYMTLSSFFY